MSRSRCQRSATWRAPGAVAVTARACSVERSRATTVILGWRRSQVGQELVPSGRVGGRGAAGAPDRPQGCRSVGPSATPSRLCRPHGAFPPAARARRASAAAPWRRSRASARARASRAPAAALVANPIRLCASDKRRVRRALGVTREGARSAKVRRGQAASMQRSRRTSNSSRTGCPSDGGSDGRHRSAAVPGTARPPASGAAPTPPPSLHRQHQPAIEFGRHSHAAAGNLHRLHHDPPPWSFSQGTRHPSGRDLHTKTTKSHSPGAGSPRASPAAVFTDAEIEVLNRAAAGPRRADEARDLDAYLIRIARLGGHLARRHDGPPGTVVMWRGFSRPADLAAGFDIGRTAAGTCG